MNKLKFISLALCVSLVAGIGFTGCKKAETDPGAEDQNKYEGSTWITLDSVKNSDGSWTHSAKIGADKEAEQFDYVWHADPSTAHDDVKNSPAEYYTGTKPETEEAVYISHDLVYYPQLDKDAFVKQNYDGEQEWCYYYTAEGLEDYVFSTLPVKDGKLPENMMHSEEEAYENAVLYITQPGSYVLTGNWHGQIKIDLGDKDDTFTDENAKAEIILNNVNVECTAAPALVFYSAYECDSAWEDREEYTEIVDTTGAGAKVIIADGSENNFSGTNVFRILKSKFKDGDAQPRTGAAQKKSWKTDGAFYSYVSMELSGEEKGDGILNINSSNEGLDSELHLTINGGNINIISADDGINVNEDGVSVATINGGKLQIVAGTDTEGDGIDSNGFLVINGGTVFSAANPRSDSGLDSDCGSFINGGTVFATGSTMDWPESESGQVTINLSFSQSQSAEDDIVVYDKNGGEVYRFAPGEFSILKDYMRSYRGAVLSSEGMKTGETYTIYTGDTQLGNSGNFEAFKPGQFGGGNGGFDFKDGERPEPPEGFDPKEMPEMGERPEPPEGFDPGNRPERPEGGPGEMPDDMDKFFKENGRPEGMEDGNIPGMPGGYDNGGELSPEFYMEDMVNSFAGVRAIDTEK